MYYINLMPHDIRFNDGTKVEKSGKVAGVREKTGEFIGDVRQDKLGEVENLPAPLEGYMYIVSMPTLLALRASGDSRTDVVCPITRGEGVKRHPDTGVIVSVPGLRTF